MGSLNNDDAFCNSPNHNKHSHFQSRTHSTMPHFCGGLNGASLSWYPWAFALNWVYPIISQVWHHWSWRKPGRQRKGWRLNERKAKEKDANGEKLFGKKKGRKKKKIPNVWANWSLERRCWCGGFCRLLQSHPLDDSHKSSEASVRT